MSLSSDSLIHITNKESLIAILGNGAFRPSFSKERILLKGGELPPVFFAMVCFCDIPFSQIKEHINLYGQKDSKAYGIGLTKEWGIRNGLNPVFYLQEESAVSEVLFNRFDKLFNDGVDKELIWDFIKLFSFIKTYEGDNMRFNNSKYRYYDEREWRWIPPEEQLNGNFPFATENNFLAAQDEYKKLLNGIKLSFVPSDVKYIIINEEDEREEIIEYIDDKFSEIDDVELNKLRSKITITTYIKSDT